MAVGVPAEMQSAIRASLENIERFLAEQEQLICNLLQAPSLDPAMMERIKVILDLIDLHVKEVRSITRSCVLDVLSLYRTRTIGNNLLLLRARYDLIAAQAQSGALPVTLHIAEQPLPQVVFKGKIMDPYAVNVLSIPGWKERSVTKMQAVLSADELPVGSVVPPAPVENDTARVDPYQRFALFNELKLMVSTRMTPVYLKFRLQMQAPTGQAITLETDKSRPFIVITNESQWSDAEGKLVLADAFEGAAEIPWPQFANSLHTHFLSCTRQDPARPSRALGDADWTYLRTKFFGTNRSGSFRSNRATCTHP